MDKHSFLIYSSYVPNQFFQKICYVLSYNLATITKIHETPNHLPFNYVWPYETFIKTLLLRQLYLKLLTVLTLSTSFSPSRKVESCSEHFRGSGDT